MKQCTLCKDIKPRDKFYVAYVHKGNPILCSRCKKCELVYQKEKFSAKAVRSRILDRLGRKCAHCGFDDLRALQIDHIHGGGKKEILSFRGNYRNYYKSIEHMPNLSDKFQVLCANCNWIKRYTNKECKYDKE